MRGYMTIDQAFECGDDDFPFIDGGYNDVPRSHQETKRTLSNYQSLGLSAAEILSDKWQVKTAEPVVLSAEELASVFIFSPKNGKFTINGGDAVDFAKMCNDNGRLERDLELRGFTSSINAILGNLDKMYGMDHWAVVEIKEAVKNLKPLNQD